MKAIEKAAVSSDRIADHMADGCKASVDKNGNQIYAVTKMTFRVIKIILHKSQVAELIETYRSIKNIFVHRRVV
jgi:uncharacterized protein (UPF0261 family)